MKIRHAHMAGIHVADTLYRTSQGMMTIVVGGYWETRDSVLRALRDAIKQSTTGKAQKKSVQMYQIQKEPPGSRTIST